MCDAVSPCRQVVTTIYATLGEMAVVDAVNELYSNTLLCNRKSVEKLAQLASKVLSSFALFLFSSLLCLALQCSAVLHCYCYTAIVTLLHYECCTVNVTRECYTVNVTL